MQCKNLQKLDKVEIQKTYITEVGKTLEAHFSHSLRATPSNINDIIAHWVALFMKAKIPADKIYPLYMDTKINLQSDDYFSADSMIVFWNNSKQERLRQQKQQEVCTVCNGTKTTSKFDFKLKQDIIVECPKCCW